MLWVGVAMLGLWFGGARAGVPGRVRLALIGLVWIAVLLALWVLPPNNGLRAALGGTAAEWIVVGVMALAIWGYSRVLARLKARAQPVAAAQTGTFSDTELERYARQIMLREIGGPGQKRLKEARVLVIGAGGLGAPVLQYLAGAGVGTIGVIDDDSVDLSNLHRQVIHRDADIGLPKVQSAIRAMAALNPHIALRPYSRRLTEDIAADLFADYDLILDGTDNFDTRYLVNRTAVALGKPLIAGALTQWEGQISTYDPAHAAPCYQCIFPEAPAEGLAPSCAEAGVAGPLPGVIGSMMAIEAVKEITGAGEGLRGRMLIYDALYADTRIIRLKRRADCPVCGGRQKIAS